MAVDIKSLQIKVSAVGIKPAANGLGALADAAVKVKAYLPSATAALEALERVSFRGVAEQSKNASDNIRGLKDSMKNIGEGGKVSTYLDKMAKSVERIVASSSGIDTYVGQLKSIRAELEGIAATGATLPRVPRTGGVSGGSGGGSHSAMSDDEKQSKAIQRLMRDLERQTIYLEKGKVGWLEYQAAQKGVSDSAAPYIARMRAATAQTGEFVMGQRQMSAAMRMVPAQFTDIATQLAGGQSPMLVLLQQGGQLRDMFGGFQPALKAVGTQILKFLTNPMMLAAGAIAAVTYAYYKGTQAESEFNRTLATTNGYIGITTQEFGTLATRAGALSGSVSGAEQALNAFAASGKVVRGNLEQMTIATVEFAKATGTDISKVAAQYASLADKPSEALRTLDKQYKFLTASTLSQVVALEREGKTLAALSLAQKTLAEAHSAMARQSLESMGTMERGWYKLKLGLSSYLEVLTSVGKSSTKEAEAYENANRNVIRAIENREKAVALANKTGRTISPEEMARYEWSINKYREERDAIVDLRKERERVANTKATNNEEQERAKDAIAWATANDKVLASKAKIAEIDGRIAAISKQGNVADKEQILLALQRERVRVQESLIDKTAASESNVIASLSAQNKALQENIKGLQARSYAYEKASEAQKEIWKLETLGGNSKRIAELQQTVSLEKQQNALREQASKDEDIDKMTASLNTYNSAMQKHIEELKRGEESKAKMSEKSQMLAKAQDAEANATTDLGRAKALEAVEAAKVAVALEKSAADEAAANAQRKANATYTNQANATLQDYLATQAEERNQMGMSNSEREKRIAWLQLEARKNQELAVVDAEIAAARKLDHQSRLKELEERRIAIEANYKRQQEASNNRPRFEPKEGATFGADARAGFENFYKGLETRQQQFQSFYANSYSLMGDTLNTFFETGKLNGREFVASMMKMVSRLITQMLILKAVQAATGMMGSSSAGPNMTAGGNDAYYDAGGSTGITGYAKGGVFSGGSVTDRFANGGAFTNTVVSKPTRFANGGVPGTGLIGEAGPEGVLPLKTGPDGRLGVTNYGGKSGGDNIQIIINVTESGESTSVSGVGGKDLKAMYEGLGQIVKRVIIEEKLPGGELYR